MKNSGVLLNRLVFVIIMCLFCLPSISSAASAIDLSEYSNEELLELIMAAQGIIAERTEPAEETPSEEFVYAVKNKKVQINAYAGGETTVVIPEEIEGFPVTTLGKGAFKNNSDLLSVEFPSTLTHIEENAFQWCYDLDMVLTIPQTLEKIDKYAFYSSGLTGVIIEGKTNLGKYSLANCDSLEFVYIREGAKPTIGRKLFEGCDNLKIAVIPSSVKNIPKDAFKDSKLLKIITPSGSAAAKFGKSNLIPVETDSYNDYVTQYESLYPKK